MLEYIGFFILGLLVGFMLRAFQAKGKSKKELKKRVPKVKNPKTGK